MDRVQRTGDPELVASAFNRAIRLEAGTTDDQAKAGKPDRNIGNTGEDELRDWARRFGVSEDRLRAAVEKAGPLLKDVARELGKPL